MSKVIKTVRPEDALWNSIDKDMRMVINRLGIPLELWHQNHDDFRKLSAQNEGVSAIPFLEQLYQIAKGKPKAAIEYLSIAFYRWQLRDHLLTVWTDENEELLFAARTKMIVAFAIAALDLQSEAMEIAKENGVGGGSMKAVNSLTRPLKVWAVNVAKTYPSDITAAAIARDIYQKKLPAHLASVAAEDPERIIAEAIRSDRKKRLGG